MDKLQDVLKQLDLTDKNSRFTPPTEVRKDANRAAWQFIDLIQGWEKIVGPRLTQSSLPLKLLDGCLVILVSHPIVAEQLKMTQLTLVRKIEKAYPHLKKQILKLGFKTNENIFKQKISSDSTPQQINVETKTKTKLHRFSPEYLKLKEKANELFSEIDDEELNETLTSIFVQVSQKK
jgi:hypothetical protein